MYLALIDDNVLQINRPLWKLKIPLKVKVFIWLLHHGVILTKDNLAKRNWQGTQQCCFCSSNETIAHLFFDCHVARLLWRIIHITFGIKRPSNIVHMFGIWLSGMQWAHTKLVYAGLCALLLGYLAEQKWYCFL